jgi:hypothetical protein
MAAWRMLDPALAFSIVGRLLFIAAFSVLGMGLTVLVSPFRGDLIWCASLLWL